MERMHPSRSNSIATRTCPRCGFGGALDDSGLCPRCLWTSSLVHDDPDPLLGPLTDSVDPGLRPVPMTARLLGGCELLEEIARGGMGVVYRARQVALNRIVAVKVLAGGPFASPDYARRFRVEAQTAARLRHPNIVAIHEVGEADGVAYFIMDLVEGPNLAERARRDPFLPREAATCVETIARAVAYAHSQGVLHRDLKPSNVLLDLFDQPQITDFGLAKQMASDSPLATGHPSLTLTGQALGSPGYAAPEQVRSGEATVQSDVYGLGATLYHLLTGRPPFAAATAIGTLHAAQHQDPVSPRALNPNVPADLETISLKCLEKEPSKRYATAQALADDLERFLNDEPILARPVTRLERAVRWCRRKPALASACGLSLVLLLLLSVASPIAAYRINEARRQAAQDAAIAAAMNEFLTEDLLRQADVWKAEAHASPNRDIRLLEIVNRASEGVDAKFASQPLVAAKIHLTVGSVYAGLGEIEKAEHHLRTTKNLFETHVGPNDPRTLEASHALAVLLRVNRAAYDEAETLIRHVFNTRQRTLGPNHRDTLSAMIALGQVRSDRQEFGEAESLFKEAVDHARTTFGIEAPLTLTGLEELAGTMWDRGEHQAAVELKREILEIRQRIQGHSHPDTLNTLVGVVWGLRETTRNWPLLERMILDGLELSRPVFGERGPTARLEGQRSIVLTHRGLFDESLELRQWLRDQALRDAGPDHPYALASSMYVAFHHAHYGNDFEALRILDETLAVYRRTAPDAFNAQVNLGWQASINWRLGNHGVALQYYHDRFATAQRLFGHASKAALSAQRQLADSRARLGDWQAAAALLDEVCATPHATAQDTLKALLVGALTGDRPVGHEWPNLLLGRSDHSFELGTQWRQPTSTLISDLSALDDESLRRVAEECSDVVPRILAGFLLAKRLHHPEDTNTARAYAAEAAGVLARTLRVGDFGERWADLALCLLAAKDATIAPGDSLEVPVVDTAFLEAARGNWAPVDAALHDAWRSARHRQWAVAAAHLRSVMAADGFAWEAAEYSIPRWPLKVALIAALAQDDFLGERLSEAHSRRPTPAMPGVFAVSLLASELASPATPVFLVNAPEMADRVEASGVRLVPEWEPLFAGLELLHAGDHSQAAARFAEAQQAFNLHCASAALAYHAQLLTRLGKYDESADLLSQADAILERLRRGIPPDGDLGSLWFDYALCELSVTGAKALQPGTDHNSRPSLKTP